MNGAITLVIVIACHKEHGSEKLLFPDAKVWDRFIRIC